MSKTADSGVCTSGLERETTLSFTEIMPVSILPATVTPADPLLETSDTESLNGLSNGLAPCLKASLEGKK